MSKNIAIIGSSGSIGSSFLKYYENENSSNVIYSLSRKEINNSNPNIHNVIIDIEDEESISKASQTCMAKGSFDVVIVATGILHDQDLSPEKSIRQIDQKSFHKVFSINTFGPALIARYFIPLLKKETPTFFGFLSARVGSISDNKTGGWYSYRASKAALNMIIKGLSIEVSRNNPKAILAGLHPGTVESNLSDPFKKGVTKDKLFTPEYSVSKMIDVIQNLESGDSGNCFAWDGVRIDF